MTLPDAKILETTVTPNAGGSIVWLQISDGSLDPASYSIHLSLSVQIPLPRRAMLAEIEHDATNLAHSVLAALVRQKKGATEPGESDEAMTPQRFGVMPNPWVRPAPAKRETGRV